MQRLTSTSRARHPLRLILPSPCSSDRLTLLLVLLQIGWGVVRRSRAASGVGRQRGRWRSVDTQGRKAAGGGSEALRVAPSIWFAPTRSRGRGQPDGAKRRFESRTDDGGGREASMPDLVSGAMLAARRGSVARDVPARGWEYRAGRIDGRWSRRARHPSAEAVAPPRGAPEFGARRRRGAAPAPLLRNGRPGCPRGGARSPTRPPVLAFQSSFVTPDRLPALASSDGRAGWRIALMGMSGSGKSTPAIIAGPPRPRPGAYAWVAGPARSRPPSGWQASVR